MLLQSEHDLVMLLGVASLILLALAILGGVVASLKSFQVRQFQDLLFKAERKIDTLERRMFNVLNAVPVALVETDATGKFTFANKAAHQLLGRKDNELLGLRFHSATWGITYPDGRVIPADLLPIARTLRGQTVKGFQHLLTRFGTQQKVLVSVTSMPVMNSIGEVIGSSAAFVELETARGEGIDDLNGLWRGHWFEAATLPFWGLDATGKILDINAAACQAFSLTRDQVIGDSWAQSFVAESDFQTAMDYLARLQEATGQGNVSTSLRLRSPRGGDDTQARVTAWRVRTHEGGEHGMTVMALALESSATDASGDAARPSAGISEDAHKEAVDQAVVRALNAAEVQHQQAMDALEARHAAALKDALNAVATEAGASQQAAIETLNAAHAAAMAEAVTAAMAEAQARAEAAHTESIAENIYGWQNAPSAPTPVIVHEADPAVAAENAELKQRLATLESDLDDMRAARNALQVQLHEVSATRPLEHQAELDAAQAHAETLRARVSELESSPGPEAVDHEAYEARIQALEANLSESRDLLAALEKRYVALSEANAQSGAQTVDWEARLAAANAVTAQVQAALDAAQAQLSLRAAPDAEIDARVRQLSDALDEAQKYETVGRLTSNVVQDFAQMLSVINGALEVMTRQGAAPDDLRRLSEAALAAGRRGERLTRQLQAFQSEEF